MKRHPYWQVFALSLLLLLASLAHGREAADEETLWAGLASGRYVALMRHALAPGTGDPEGFRLEDCTTQRNLSAQGREQARAIGERFRRHGIEKASVRSSRWCRCLETARLLDLGEVIPTPALDSFFTRRDLGPAQSEAVRRMLEEHPAEQARILVTHQVNITALTGVYPRSGEVVVVRPGQSLEVAGRLTPR